MDVVESVNEVPIRLTDERWRHITTAHPEMADLYFDILETISEPDKIVKGNKDELIALNEIEEPHYLVVIYKEVNENDGFIITALKTSKPETFQREHQVWP